MNKRYDENYEKVWMPKVVSLAHEILDMQEELEILRKENRRLQGIEQKYGELLDSSISHSQKMMFGILDIAMTPGVMNAIDTHNQSKEKEKELPT